MMNKKQKFIALVGVFLIFIMGLVPPWRMTIKNVSTFTVYPIGYSFIFLPPDFIPEDDQKQEDENMEYSITLDVSRLLIQWVTILFVTASLLFIFKDKLPDEGEGDDFSNWLQ